MLSLYRVRFQYLKKKPVENYQFSTLRELLKSLNSNAIQQENKNSNNESSKESDQMSQRNENSYSKYSPKSIQNESSINNSNGNDFNRSFEEVSKNKKVWKPKNVYPSQTSSTISSVFSNVLKNQESDTVKERDDAKKNDNMVFEKGSIRDSIRKAEEMKRNQNNLGSQVINADTRILQSILNNNNNGNNLNNISQQNQLELGEVTPGEKAFLQKREFLNRKKEKFDATINQKDVEKSNNNKINVKKTNNLNTGENKVKENKNINANVNTNVNVNANVNKVKEVKEIKEKPKPITMNVEVLSEEERLEQDRLKLEEIKRKKEELEKLELEKKKAAQPKLFSVSEFKEIIEKDAKNMEDVEAIERKRFKRIRKSHKKKKRVFGDKDARSKRNTIIKEVRVPENGIMLKQLASSLSIKLKELKHQLIELGADEKINHLSEEEENMYKIDVETAELVILEYGIEVKRVKENDIEFDPKKDCKIDSSLSGSVEESNESLIPFEPRAPIVSIMGHVDHGKTTLLDYLRKANVAAGEAGGITQKISAFTVSIDTPSSDELENFNDEANDEIISSSKSNDKNDKNGNNNKSKVIFLDTPGHAAFSAMRQSGAAATDVIVLVVAIDDGVRPQTIEAIQAAQAADCSIVVAINKIDKFSGSERSVARSRILGELSNYGVIAEEFGGDVMVMEVSGKTGEGIPGLIESLALQTEVLELKAPSLGFAEATVLEASVEKGRGIIVSALTTWGLLSVGDAIVVGTSYGKVKTIITEDGKSVTKVGPSTPVKISGLRSLPLAGQALISVPSESRAKDIADRRLATHNIRKAQAEALSRASQTVEEVEVVSSDIRKRKKLTTVDQNSTSSSSSTSKSGSILGKINVVLKADGPGTLSALSTVVQSLIDRVNEFEIAIVDSSVGQVTLSDAKKLASVSGESCILAFNVGLSDNSVRSYTNEMDIRVLRNTIIYRLEDELVEKMSSMLPKQRILSLNGSAKVQEVFTLSGKSSLTVAGLIVESGVVSTDSTANKYKFKVIREGVAIAEEITASEMKKNKEFVQQAEQGTECGLVLENYNDFKSGDIIECYKIEWKNRALDLKPNN